MRNTTNILRAIPPETGIKTRTVGDNGYESNRSLAVVRAEWTIAVPYPDEMEGSLGNATNNNTGSKTWIIGQSAN